MASSSQPRPGRFIGTRLQGPSPRRGNRVAALDSCLTGGTASSRTQPARGSVSMPSEHTRRVSVVGRVVPPRRSHSSDIRRWGERNAIVVVARCAWNCPSAPAAQHGGTHVGGFADLDLTDAMLDECRRQPIVTARESHLGGFWLDTEASPGSSSWKEPSGIVAVRPR
jgi:hypothetical protein